MFIHDHISCISYPVCQTNHTCPYHHILGARPNIHNHTIISSVSDQTYITILSYPVCPTKHTCPYYHILGARPNMIIPSYPAMPCPEYMLIISCMPDQTHMTMLLYPRCHAQLKDTCPSHPGCQA